MVLTSTLTPCALLDRTIDRSGTLLQPNGFFCVLSMRPRTWVWRYGLELADIYFFFIAFISENSDVLIVWNQDCGSMPLLCNLLFGPSSFAM